MEDLEKHHRRVYAAFVASEKKGFKFDVVEFYQRRDRLTEIKKVAAASRGKAKRESRVRVVASG